MYVYFYFLWKFSDNVRTVTCWLRMPGTVTMETNRKNASNISFKKFFLARATGLNAACGKYCREPAAHSLNVNVGYFHSIFMAFLGFSLRLERAERPSVLHAPQTAVRPVLPFYISTSLAPLIQPRAAAAARLDLFHYLLDLLLRIICLRTTRAAEVEEGVWFPSVTSTVRRVTSGGFESPPYDHREVARPLRRDPGLKCQRVFNLWDWARRCLRIRSQQRVMECCSVRGNVLFSGWVGSAVQTTFIIQHVVK